MTHAAVRAAALLSLPLMVAMHPAEGRAAPGFEPIMHCLPGDGTGAFPCASAPAQSAVLLRLRPPRAAGPVMTMFKELSPSHKAQMLRLTVPDTARNSDGSYRVVLPSTLCARRSGRTRYEVFQINPALQNMRSLGVLTVDC